MPRARVTEVLPDGTFEFRDVLPGLYGLYSEPGGVSETGEPLPAFTTYADVAVSSNVTGLRVSLRPVPQITGVIVMEDGSTSPENAAVRFVPFEGAPAGPVVMVRKAGILQMRAGATKYLWTVGGLPEAVYVKSVSFAGQDITHAPLDNRSGAGGTMRIVLSSKAAIVTGFVRDDRGQPKANVAVSLWPKSGSLVDPIKQTPTDQNGGFQFAGLAPGDYYLAAWEAIDLDIAQNPEFLARFQADATVVMLEESDRVAVDTAPIPGTRIAAEMAKLP